MTAGHSHAETLNAFADGETLAEALSDRVALALEEAIATRGAATLAVSGGSTPKRFFQSLAQRSLPWDQVTVTLVDERFVPPADERSNHRLVATHLLQKAAARAAFVPLFTADLDARQAAALANDRIGALPRPLDIAILGMGLDGHTASWFPDSPQLAACIDPHTQALVLATEAPGAAEPRLTLTLPVIAAAALRILHIEGEDKKRIYDEALKPGSPMDLPVRALLHGSGPPHIYWAP